MIKSTSAIFAAMAAACILPAVARSQVLAVATTEGSFSQRINNSTWTALALGNQTFQLPFTTTANNDRVVITYSTSCLALGFEIRVRANVDGKIAAPGTTTGVPLCFNTVSGSSYAATRVFSIVVPAKGNHTLAIEAKGNGAAIQIGDAALVVQH